MEKHGNVVLFVFDTLRPDFLSCYGEERVTTTNLDSVARDGVKMNDAFAVGPGTPISHGGIFTGQYPSNSGVTGQYIDLPQDNPTLPEWFQAEGYDTFGIAGPSKIASDFGFDRGFDHYFEPYYDIGYQDRKPTKDYFKNVLTDVDLFKDAYRTAVRGELNNTRFKFDYLRQQIESSSGPFFAFANLLEAHAPYHPPHGYRERFDPDFTEPRLFLLEYLLDQTGTHEDDQVSLDRVDSVQSAEGIGQFLADPTHLNEKEIEVLIRWYRASVKYLDEEFGRFLDFYREHLADDTYLVVTADHGEQFGEHGLLEHSHHLYDETLRVPLLITGPDLPTEDGDYDLASLVDLYDTLSDLAGIDIPEFTDGQSLFAEETRDVVFMEHGEREIEKFRQTPHGSYMSDSKLREFSMGRKAIRSEEYKLMVNSSGGETLYDVSERPEGEIVNESVTETYRERLFSVLGETYGTWPEGDPEEYDLNQDVVNNLEDLGYL